MFHLFATIIFAIASTYPSGLNGPSDVISGVFPGTDAGSCCWVGQDATLRLELPPGANAVSLSVFLPDYAVRNGPRTLTARFGDSSPVERCCIGAGAHEVAFALPQGVQPGRIVLRLHIDRTFVPKQLGINADDRRLSLMLRGVTFPNAPASPIALLLLAIAGVLVFALTLKRPMYACIALLATDPFLFEHATHGASMTLPKVALVAAALALLPRIQKIVRLGPMWAFGALAICQLLFVASMLPGASSALSHDAVAREALKGLEYLLTIAVAYLAYRLDPDEKFLRLTASAVVIVVSAMAFVQGMLRVDEAEVIAGETLARIAGPLEGPNQLAGFLDVTLPVILAFALMRKAMLAEWIALALGSAAFLFTFSRGGVAAGALAIAALLLVHYFPRRRAVVFVALATVFAIVLGLATAVFSSAIRGGFASLFGRSGAGTFNGGLASRVDLWHAAYELWRARPIFGIGVGNFELEVSRFLPGARTHANGMFFQVLAEQGVFGLAAMLAVTLSSVAVFFRRLGKPLVLGACMASVAMALHQIVDCMWLFPKVGVMWWAILGCAAADVDRSSEAD